MENVTKYYDNGIIRQQHPKSGIAGLWKNFNKKGKLRAYRNFNEEGQFHGEYFHVSSILNHTTRIFHKNDLTFGQQKYIQK